MTNTYSRACNEVLIILRNYLSVEEYNKIPREKLEFFEKNIDVHYNYEINKNLPLSEQKISEKANAIIVTLYRDYFANEYQKKKVNEFLQVNEQMKIEKKAYNVNNSIFDKKEKKENEDKISKNIEKNNSENMQLVEYKENIFKKMWNKIKSFFKKK